MYIVLVERRVRKWKAAPCAGAAGLRLSFELLLSPKSYILNLKA